MATLGIQRELTSLKSVPLVNRGYPSLFQPDSDDELSSDSGSEREYQQSSQPTHLSIDEVVTNAPASLAMLLESLLPRLQPSQDVKGVSLQDQKSLTDVLVGELASEFSVIQHQIDDPFLSPVQNRDMHRRIVVRVCEIIVELHEQFTVKAAAIGSASDEVFSAAANLSRIRAELTLEANKRLNIPQIRREVLTQIKRALPSIAGKLPTGHVTFRTRIKQTRLPPIPKQELKKRTVRRMSLSDLKLGESLGNKMVSFGVRLESGAVRKRINKLHARVPDQEHEELETSVWDETSSRPSTSKSPVNQPSLATKLHRVLSMPELWGAFILCDMGLTSRTDRPTEKREEEGLLGVHRSPSVGNFMDLKLSTSGNSSKATSKPLEEYMAQDLSKDLADLCASSPSQDASGVDELHPLLEAHGHGLSVRAAQRLAQYDAELRKEQESVREESTLTEEMESRIPSVATLDQLPYLNFDHTEGTSSSHPSLHVKSGPSLNDSHSDSLSRPPDHSQLLTDLGGTSSEQSGLKLGDAAEMFLPSELDLSVGGGSVCQRGESLSRASKDHSGVSAMGQSVLERSGIESMWESSTGFNEALVDTLEPRDQLTPRPPSPAPQSAAITTKLENGGVVRTIDVQVSERVPLHELRLKPFGPIYNQLTGELDSSMMAELDSSLHEGRELREVYEEIMKTLPTTHLQFTHEPTLEPALNVPIDLSQIIASNTLHHRRSRRVINKELYRSIPHPWGEGVSRTDWERSNQYQGDHPKEYGNTSGAGGVSLSPRLAHPTRAYNTWANLWNATVNPEDYLKYASREESDYLRLMYHLYDSEGSDSEAEEEVRLKREKLEMLHKKLKAKEARRRQRYSAKSLYQTGVWNVNTVMMGGLGGDPDCSSDEEELKSSVTSQEQPQQTVSSVEAQERLGEIWQRLHFPQSLQMDMAIKYSNPRLSVQLGKVLTLWEVVCTLVEKREALMSRLENFEREASDPSRLFSNGNKGFSSNRLREAKKRDSLHKELDNLDKKVSRIVQQLRTQYGDIVTYKGRPYCDKMSYDRTEMLYWLQQERRAAILKPASVALSMNPPQTVVNS